MARKALKVAPMKTQPLLIVAGQFFVFTVKEVQVHVLDAMATSLLYDGLGIADTRSERSVDMHRAYVVRQTFGRDAIGFLPAGTAEALWYYAEHYEGTLAEQVKGLAACILSGTPYTPDSPHGGGIIGGLKVKAPVAPQKPTGPNGVAFAFPQERIQPLSEIFAEEEIRLMEGSQI